MPSDKIKVVAPSSNPHICYISRNLKDKVEYIKDQTGMSLYALICASAGHSLKSSGDIKAFKNRLKKLGYKNIGEWADEMIQEMYDSLDFINIPKPQKRSMKI